MCLIKIWCLISTAKQNWAAGTRFILPPETTEKLDEIYEKISLKTLDIRKLRPVLPERQEIKVSGLAVTSAYCLEQVSKPLQGKPQESWWYLWGVEMDRSSAPSQRLKVYSRVKNNGKKKAGQTWHSTKQAEMQGKLPNSTGGTESSWESQGRDSTRLLHKPTLRKIRIWLGRHMCAQGHQLLTLRRQSNMLVKTWALELQRHRLILPLPPTM